MAGSDDLFKQVLEANKTRQMFEEAINAVFTLVLSAGDGVVDGGAHRGRHTYPCADLVGTEGIVHAFEVLPPLVDWMAKTLAEGRYPQIRLHAKALSNRADQELQFKWIKNAWGHSGLRDRDHGGLVPEIEEFEVTTTTIDSFSSPDMRRLRFVKLDLEGGEFDAIVGAERTLRTWRPLIAFENGRGGSAKEYGYTMEAFFAFFSEMDYALFDILGRPFTPREWGLGGMPWDFFAASRRDDKDLIATAMPGVFERLLAKA